MKIAALAAVLALAGCSAEVPPEQKPATPPATGAAPAGAPAASAYPLATCVVSGEKLGEMGEPVKIDYQGTEVRFCCNKCVAEFNKDPKKYLAVLEAARKK